MKTNVLWLGLTLAVAWACCPALPSARASDNQPNIQSIELAGQEVVVTVHVPAGVRKVTLESRSRIGAGAWIPRAIERFEGQGGTAVFRLPKSGQLELLRVRADAEEPLPAGFYEGKQEFGGPASTVPTSPGLRASSLEDGAGAPGGAEDSSSREVVESDIWRIAGDTLYFFNTYRGLQVIDLTTPDAPIVRGTLPLPAAGEQLYVVKTQSGADRVLLLARDGCGWNATDQSQVIVIDPAPSEPESSGSPKILTSVNVPGYIAESRLVGSALYVASQSYRRVQQPPTNPGEQPVEQWEYGTVVSSFDFADPAAPVSRDQFWFPGYGNTIAATDRFLFVVMTENGDWWRSKVQIVDIASPDGAMAPRGVVRPAGRVADKFKMNLAGDVFTVISEVSQWSEATRQVSVLETFSFADPMAPAKLGQLEVGKGESLYATRFDGDRAYIVTFLRIDPLWVVDLSDPAHPTVFGELETPGWSTYIHPLGDRLVTVGIDNTDGWRTTVALFDVADPAKPALLAKVPLGEGYSSSEANYDEKAFTVLPEAGLILVPYQGWSENGYAARVQLIDLEPDTLTVRGVIEHAMQPRRATMRGERILSISGRELLCVDAANRDQPALTAELELSWPVDRVLPIGEHIIEIANGQSWYANPAPVLRVVREAQPDEVLQRLKLPETMPVLSATIRDGVLYVVQGETWWEPVTPEKPDEAQSEVKGRMALSTYSLADLPELSLLGTVKTDVSSLDWAGEMDALWPKPGLLVLASGGSGYWWRGPWLDMPARIGAVDAWWPWWGGGSGRLVAFDVADATAPKLTSDLSLGTDGQWWDFSEAFTAKGLVFVSHQASEFLEGVTLPGQPPPQPYEVVKADGSRETVFPPVGVWVTKHYLNVVDYADPGSPTPRPSVNLPGRLTRVSADGSLLFTSGPHWDVNWQTDWTDYVDVCAYDDVSVTLLASLKLPTEWPRASAVGQDTIFVARKAASPATGGVVEAWQLSLNRALEKQGEVALDVPANSLRSLGSLLVAQSDQQILVIDAADAKTLRVLGRGITDGCLWPNIEMAEVLDGRSLWVPLGEFGAMSIPLAPIP